MVDTRDIVERLRAISSALSSSGYAGCDAMAEALCHQAAAEIARLREERRWIENQVVISRETFDKVVAALGRCTIISDPDGEEWNDEEVIDARDSIRRDAKNPLPPGPEGDGNG